MSDKGSKKIEINITNSITVGQWLGITDRHVRRLVEDGIIQTVSRGKYDLQDCVRKYLLYIRQQNQSSKSDKEVKLDYDIEHAKHEKIKREKAELQFRVMKGELHRAEDVEMIMTDMIANARTKLLGIPSKAAALVVGYTEIPKVQSILQKIIYEVLEELSNYSPELFINEQVLNYGNNDEEIKEE